MQPARRYQRFAARCLEEARAATDPRLKVFLAEMAQEWLRLVEEANGERGKRDFRGPEGRPWRPEHAPLETGSIGQAGWLRN